LDPATDADQLSYLVLAGAARTFVDLAAPRQDWVGPEGAERLVIYGDSGTALSTDVVTPIFQQAYRTHVAARPGFRYDQMLAFVDKVQASAGPEGAGDIVVVQGGTNDAIQASIGVWDLGRSPIVGSTFMERNPQARCFVYVTAAAYSSAPTVNAASAELNLWIRDLPAADGRVQVADWDGLVRDYEARGEPDGPIILDDRLHPNPLGQRLLAEAILDAAARCPAR
jgi:lysophospholipase L1-like esterase